MMLSNEMENNNKSKIKDIIFLNIIILYYPVVSIIAEIASRYEVMSVPFIKMYILEAMAIAVYAILWQRAIKKFPLSMAYSNKALVIVYNMFWAYILFNEEITINNIIGSIIILIGTWVVVKDDK